MCGRVLSTRTLWLLAFLISVLSVELGAGIKCFDGNKDGPKEEKECDAEVKLCVRNSK